jgi:hypothetical protein
MTSNIILGLTIAVLKILYWYTRMTSVGIDSAATFLAACAVFLEIVAGVIKASSAKLVGLGISYSASCFKFQPANHVSANHLGSFGFYRNQCQLHLFDHHHH